MTKLSKALFTFLNKFTCNRKTVNNGSIKEGSGSFNSFRPLMLLATQFPRNAPRGNHCFRTYTIQVLAVNEAFANSQTIPVNGLFL